ncbi:hypothetical protein TRAPUB_1466 [Trametes pubescens]|uniref:Uncharacterized protein n=1 Tax=Trametes pubescens TaxID=154538 RepID=A0A1M2VJB0_TRAPU|nr:hypothetical protein TRAPUB_1466 [Trametes pubescens]
MLRWNGRIILAPTSLLRAEALSLTSQRRYGKTRWRRRAADLDGGAPDVPSDPGGTPPMLREPRSRVPSVRRPRPGEAGIGKAAAGGLLRWAAYQYGKPDDKDAEFCSLDGLMTPPDSPDKIARGQPDFHPMLDAAGRPYAFDVRTGPVLPPQFMNAPAINHAVNRMVIHVGGLYTVEVVGRNIPTIYELSGQLASASARKSSLLGNRGGFAGLTLRSIDRGVAVCDLHLRNL